MTVLHIGPEERQRVAHLRQFAEDRAHWYRIGDSWTPGDLPEYAVTISGFRCVFTWTVGALDGDRGVYRHLSISSPKARPAPSPDGPVWLPIPYVCWWIASLFGFTGFDADAPRCDAMEPPSGWFVRVDRKSLVPNVVMAQRVPDIAP